ncbi:MAG: neutral/alkaline non-lysosomal ceramidase N-terminal domain-containing protein [bacterium]
MNTSNGRRFTLCTILSFAFLLTSCAAVKIDIDRPRPRPVPAAGSFQAGAAKVDITPPPGYPMGGFGLAGRWSRGWWTRLYARALYLEDSKGGRLALVSCDLWGLPAGLADRVAEVLAEQMRSSHPGREQIVVVATHTHHSPGNYSSSRVYNFLASPESGFDEHLFQFLANRIAHAIARAIESSRPATVKMANVDLYGVSRNRSLKAFNRNQEQERAEILSHVPVDTARHLFTDDLPATVTSDSAFRAVDPGLTVLKVEARNAPQGPPMAVAAFFAVHPTAMGATTEVYSSDIFGVAATLVEQQFSSDSSNAQPVVALFNGAEGDVSPNWKKQDRQNTLRLGTKLARGILSALEQPAVEVQSDIEYRFEVVTIKDQPVSDLHGDAERLSCVSSATLRTGKRAFPGAGTLGGAEDGRTLFFHFGLREGVVSKTCDSRHGYKLFSVKPLLQKLIHLNPDGLIGTVIGDLVKGDLTKSFPKKLPLGVYTMGQVVLATLPGEFTVTQGHRISQTLRAATDGGSTVLLVGPANEYLSYFSTPLEYNAQHYEGASTMYGQAAGVFVEQELQRIDRLPANTARYERTVTYDAGPGRGSGFGRIQDDKWQPLEALQNILQDPGTGSLRRNFPRFDWQDKTNYLSEDNLEPSTRVNPEIAIEEQTGTGWQPLRVPALLNSGQTEVVESDTKGLNFVTTIPTVVEETATWRSYWLVPEGIDLFKSYRFVVTTPAGEKHVSEPFKVSDFSHKM